MSGCPEEATEFEKEHDIKRARARSRNQAAERTSFSEIYIRNKILILDRGFFSEDVTQFLDGREISYIISANNNNELPQLLKIQPSQKLPIPETSASDRRPVRPPGSRDNMSTHALA